ncbi:MAG: NAD(P)H-dependent oxidoreductase [Bacteroidetes bacterium]|nr:NAD(P)H-dependent oxidoreductase [Bacteroidota bacterium]
MLKIAIIVGSTRPNRKGKGVGDWVFGISKKRTDAEFELVDIAEYNLPLLDEPVPPSSDNYTKEHTKNWSAKIKSFDGFIFVTPEYNHSTSAALKNGLDFLYKEWNNKSAGFVSYGFAGGIRAVEQLRPIMATLQMADVRTQVTLSFQVDFENDALKPAAHQEKTLNKLFDEVIAWGTALKTLRK